MLEMVKEGCPRTRTKGARQTLAVTCAIAAVILSVSMARGQVAGTIDPTEAFREYSHDVLQAENGLAEDSIQAIAQSSDGFLWLGTERGLVRFDGLRFKVFTHQNTPELADNYIQTLFTDADGILWIGTRSGGLTSYQRDSFRHFANGPAGKSVNQIARDRAGRLWTATNSGLDQLVDGKFVPAITNPEIPKTRITALMADYLRDLWVGTEASGLIRIAASSGASQTVRGLSSLRIQALFQDHQGTIWIGTDGGG